MARQAVLSQEQMWDLERDRRRKCRCEEGEEDRQAKRRRLKGAEELGGQEEGPGGQETEAAEEEGGAGEGLGGGLRGPQPHSLGCLLELWVGV